MAQSRAGQDAATGLAANAKNLKSKDWPYPIVDLYLGREMSADTIFAMAGDTDNRCEANFYIGEWHLIQGRTEEALAALRSVVETCRKDFYEYEGAVAELARIDK